MPDKLTCFKCLKPAIKAKVECVVCKKTYHISCSLRVNKNCFLNEDEFQCCSNLQPLVSPDIDSSSSLDLVSVLNEIKNSISSLIEEFEQMRADVCAIKNVAASVKVLKEENNVLKTPYCSTNTAITLYDQLHMRPEH